MQPKLLALVVWLAASAASAGRFERSGGVLRAEDSQQAKSRLPIRHPERVAEICGFDDTADALSTDSPWGQYAAEHQKYLAAGRTLRYRGALQGHGTRLRGFLYAFLLAMRSKRALVLDWTGLDAAIEPNFVDWRGKSAASFLTVGSHLRGQADSYEDDGGPWYKLGDEDVFKQAEYDSVPEVKVEIGCIPSGQWGPNGVIKRCGWEVTDDPGMLQLPEEHRSSWNLFGCGMRFLLRPTAQLNAQLAYGGWLSSSDGLMGAVQMRFGDKVAFNRGQTTSFGHGNDIRLPADRSSVEKMLKCISRPTGHVYHSEPRLLFASDWNEAKKWAAESESEEVKNHLQVVTLAPAPVHAEFENRDPASTELSLWTEMLMLGAVERLAVSGSRDATLPLYENNLFNNDARGARGNGLCRGSGFAMASAAIGLLHMDDEVLFGAEDCHLACG